MKEIIEKNKRRIKAIIKNITGGENEDIEQEVYIKVWRSKSDMNTIAKFANWISVVTANTCRDFVKSKQYKTEQLKIGDESKLEIVSETKTPEKIVDLKQRQKIILKAVDELPKKMREVLVLYEFEEQSYDEIAKKLSIPIGTVKSRLSCARTVLKEELSELIGD